MGDQSLRDFMTRLEAAGELRRVSQVVDPHLEITEVCRRTLCAGGPALLFERPKDSKVPLLGNVFGTTRRVAMAMGRDSVSELREIGSTLAKLREPQIPKGFSEALEQLPAVRRVLQSAPREARNPACQEVILADEQVDLAALPIQTCWPGDAGPLINFGLVVTKGPYKERLNIGIYRQQVIARNKVIMRWLAHRGGAIDFRDWKEANPGERFPVSVAIGADPATTIAAVTPIPDTMSEYRFAGLLRGGRSQVARCRTNGLLVPASSEIVLEGYIQPGETALEGPFADHTGYYDAQETFPVFTVECITHRREPIYHSTYNGRSPYDEPSILAVALNEIYIPLLQQQFPEIVDFYLPPEGCSYRVAVVSIKKRYPGHARSVMFGVWSYLRQFTYTKFVIVTDDDIDARDWKDVIWAISTRVDPARDVLIVDRTPIDNLDFASPVAGLGAKMGVDATNKWPGETEREWGRPISMSEDVVRRVDELMRELERQT